MPVRDVLVRDSRRHVEHDDSALSLDIIPITKSTKLLLSGGVPYVEADGTEVCVKGEGMNLDANCGL